MSTEATKENIDKLAEREKSESRKSPLSHRLAHKVAAFTGSISFIVFHICLFGGWILFNSFSEKAFDPFPFVMLTTTVSLEAIFLTAFVMLSQNELSRRTELKHDLDLQVNLLAEKESTEIVKFLIKVGKKLEMPQEDWKDLQALTEDTNPEEMIERIADANDLKPNK